ncbi:MAG: hypothetical protein J0H42_35440 [Rhizobiales bacterium]|nr:hypothetical protein [Hyphomicrobiales bacterium]
MREIARPAVRVLSLACLAPAMAGLAFAMAIGSSSDVLAQAKQQQAPPPRQAPAQAAPPQQEAPLKQIALTEAQIQNVLKATAEMDPITDKIDDDAKPDPKITAQLEGIAKKNGFASYADYNLVVDNINLVLGGFDTTTKKYVGPEAVIRAQIAEVQADKKMSAKDKKEELDDLNDALKSPGPAVENKGNIDLVTKYYDKLVEALSETEE